MVNRERPHLFILPEDKEDNNLVDGFLLHPRIDPKQIQTLPFSRGWTNVRDEFEKDHIGEMRKWRERRMILLIDFDRREDRFTEMIRVVPEDLRERTFIFGASHEPEEIRRDTGRSVEEIGESLADECVSGSLDLWNHPMIAHNRPEFDRLCRSMREFLILR